MSLAQACSENPILWFPSNAPTAIPSSEQHGVVNHHPQSYYQQYNNERINPNLLSAFKQNPYTQSLHSAA